MLGIDKELDKFLREPLARAGVDHGNGDACLDAREFGQRHDREPRIQLADDVPDDAGVDGPQRHVVGDIAVVAFCPDGSRVQRLPAPVYA